MGIFRRALRDGVEQRQYYPEPWFITERPVWRIVYRGLLGRPMDGVRWTDSTFWRSASSGEDHWWLRLAGWQRSMLRVCGAWSLLMLTMLPLLWMWGAHELVLQVLTAHAVAAAAPLLLMDHYMRKEHGLRLPLLVSELVELSEQQELELKGADAPTVRRWRWVSVVEGRRTWEREVVEPLAAAVSGVVDNAFRPGEARRWISVPRDYAEPGGGAVEILLPRSFTATTEQAQRRLLTVVRQKLGMLELEAHWQLKGNAPRLLVSAPPAPPKVAHYAAYREQLLRSTEPYRPVLGVVSSGELLSAEMVDDSPHIAFSAGSGAGKSMMLRVFIAQALHWGWSVVVLDCKGESHEWAEGLPGVRYVRSVEGIHDMCVRIGEEVEIRKGLSKEERTRRPRVLVVREEWNMAAAMLAEYWSALRSTAESDEKRTMPVRSPALSAVMMLDFMGRAFGMFDALIAQRMSNRVFNGNTDIRENFMIRLLARYTAQTWKMLVPHLKYMKRPAQLGRWVVVAGDEATYVQGILMSEDEARELATSGVRPAPSPFAAAGIVDDAEVDPGMIDTASTQGDQLPHGVDGGYELRACAERVILRKLVDISTTLEYLGVTEKMLQHWRDREKSFPEMRGGTPRGGYLYDLTEVTEWVRRKRASQEAEKVRK